MVLYYDIPVYRDVYSLILEIFEYTKDFNREYKYFQQKAEYLVVARRIDRLSFITLKQ